LISAAVLYGGVLIPL